MCRDEYLFFDYRNPALIEQFLSDGTHQPIEILKSGLCREQYAMLKAQLLAAKEHGASCFLTLSSTFSRLLLCGNDSVLPLAKYE